MCVSITLSDQLLRKIGTIGVALIVLNSMMGAGIFALPATVSAITGSFSPWLFIIIGTLFMSVVLTFSSISSYFEGTGGPVLYTRSAFGPHVGFGTGWVLYVSRATAFAANVSVMSVYAGAFWPALADGAARIVFICAVVGLLTWTNYVGVRDGLRTLLVLSVLKLTPLLLLIVAGLAEASVPFLPEQLPALSDFGDVSLLVIYAFVGFESATIVSGEIDRPAKTMPVALLATVAAVAVFYFFVVLVYVANTNDYGDSLSDVGEQLLGSTGAILVSAAALFSIGGNLAAILLAASRLTFALGEQDLFPRWFAEVHPRYSTPGNSILMLGGLSLILALSGTFAILAVASSLTRLLTYILCIGALPPIKRKAGTAQQAEAFRLPGGYTIPLLSLALCLWMIAQSPARAWLVTGVLLALGFGIYGFHQLRRKHATYDTPDSAP